MSESTPAPTAPPAPEPITPEKSGGFFQNLVDVYFAPGEAFGRIVRDPRFLVPLIAVVVLSVGFYAIWVQNVDAEVFIEEQIKQSPFADRIPPEQMDEIVKQQAEGLTGWTGWLRPLLASPIIVMAMAGLFWMIFRFFYGADVRFKQAAAITVWSFLAYSLITSPLTLSVLALKDDWNINPETALQANPTLLLEQEETAPALWTFLGSLDLFSFWLMFLLATGFGIAIRKSTSSAIWGIVVLWALYVGVKVGFAALF
jgi:hypothetical protein